MNDELVLWGIAKAAKCCAKKRKELFVLSARRRFVQCSVMCYLTVKSAKYSQTSGVIVFYEFAKKAGLYSFFFPFP